MIFVSALLVMILWGNSLSAEPFQTRQVLMQFLFWSFPWSWFSLYRSSDWALLWPLKYVLRSLWIMGVSNRSWFNVRLQEGTQESCPSWLALTLQGPFLAFACLKYLLSSPLLGLLTNWIIFFKDTTDFGVGTSNSRLWRFEILCI